MTVRHLVSITAVMAAWCLCAACAGAAPWEVEFETGAVFSGYNDIRIPGDTGTEVSFVDDLKTDSRYFLRLRLTHRFNRRHSLSVLVAPLSLKAAGSVAEPVIFEDVEFPAGTHLEGTYRFDSYRLTYGYTLYPTEALTATLGLTAKIRDAAVRLESSTLNSEKTNTGFVPLLYGRLLWSPRESMSVLFEADALAAPQGRAEDVLFAFQYALNPVASIRFGYRMLEGGADNEEVYNFTLLNYVVVGMVLNL
jgi:hypothetical protein